MVRAKRTDRQWATALGTTLLAILDERDGEEGTTKWLAVKVGMDPATMSKKLNGRLPITLDQVAWMAEALGVTRRSLLNRLGFIEPVEEEIDLNALSPEGRDAILGAYRSVLAGQRSRQGPVDGLTDSS